MRNEQRDTAQRRREIFALFALFAAYRKTAASEELSKLIEEAEKPAAGKPRIRCPHCFWEPRATSRWCCADCDAPEYFYHACGRLWNTFATRGRCPGCAHQWRFTSCLSCRAWSRHEDWYEQKKDG